MSEPTAVKSRRGVLLLILVIVQALFLCGIAGSYYAVGWFGSEVKIKTIPIDPRDILYGDYVTLAYEISRLNPTLWKESSGLPKSGDNVYVLLKPTSGGLYAAEGIYAKKPAVSSGQVVLKGVVDSSWDESISIEYGLERYYVPEGTGHDLEAKAGDMTARVKIAPWGQARIMGLE
jgi:uncharacterized membrane-anchored protein